MTHGWWRGRRVLMTGQTGFKGAWLWMWLRELGAEVCGYSLPPPTEPSLYALARLSETGTAEAGDVRDGGKLAEALKRSRAEVVLHLAAQSLVREGYRDPAGTYATNVMGTVNLLEAVRTVGQGVRGVVVVTTDKCYENREWLWGYRENEPMGGRDPYSNSKGCAELVTAAYRESYFKEGTTAVASVRAGNVIGGGDWARDRLIPDILRALEAGKAAVIRNPDAIRPWQFVLEPLAGYLTLAEKLAEEGQRFAEAWNFGPADEDCRPVRWIADEMVRQWGGQARWELSAGEHPHEASYLKLDASKARSRLGWKPGTDLGTALRWIVQWHQGLMRGEDAGQLCRRQLELFMASPRKECF